MIEHPKGQIATADENLHPWHCLGTRVDGAMTIEEALDLTGSNDVISLRTMYDEDGQPIRTHKEVHSSIHGQMFCAGGIWWPLQRREVLELAYTIVGQDRFDARIETVGNVGEHAEVFFAYMRFEDLVIDPSGVCDRIERGLYAATSYNQTLANIFGYSNVQLACMNALSMRLKGLGSTISVKHTRNAEARIVHAAEVLGYVGAVEEATRKTAEKMLGIDGGQALDSIERAVFPVDESMTARMVTMREKERDAVRERYETTYSARYGANAWAAWGALTERDHTRNIRVEKGRAQQRAYASVFPGVWSKTKAAAQAAVFADAGVELQGAGSGAE